MKKLLIAALAFAASTVHAQDIKALSAEEVSQYLSGAGMGYAKPAELNHFPGPLHVLELADRLGLSEPQRLATRQLMDRHKSEARAIGAKLIESQRSLEALFRSGSVTPEALAKAVQSSAALEGEYRLSHLETHRRMRALLTEDQVKRYDALRGYSDGSPSHQHHEILKR
jgi:heavy-metal resistance protein